MITTIRYIPGVAAITLTTTLPVGAALYVNDVWRNTNVSLGYKICTLPFQILGGAVFGPLIIAAKIDDIANDKLKNK